MVFQCDVHSDKIVYIILWLQYTVVVIEFRELIVSLNW